MGNGGYDEAMARIMKMLMEGRVTIRDDTLSCVEIELLYDGEELIVVVDSAEFSGYPSFSVALDAFEAAVEAFADA